MKRFLAFAISFLLVISAFSVAGAHSGRTDGSGGHKDNKNPSGLGSYHYHCGGNPPHLHANGCPYSAGSRTSATAKPTATATAKPTTQPATRATAAPAARATATPATKNSFDLSTYDVVTNPEQYEFGITNIQGINLREDASSQSARAGVVRNTGTPLLIMETVQSGKNGTWYRVALASGEVGYIFGDLIDLLEVDAFLSLVDN